MGCRLVSPTGRLVDLKPDAIVHAGVKGRRCSAARGRRNDEPGPGPPHQMLQRTGVAADLVRVGNGGKRLGSAASPERGFARVLCAEHPIASRVD